MANVLSIITKKKVKNTHETPKFISPTAATTPTKPYGCAFYIIKYREMSRVAADKFNFSNSHDNAEWANDRDSEINEQHVAVEKTLNVHLFWRRIEFNSKNIFG